MNCKCCRNDESEGYKIGRVFICKYCANEEELEDEVSEEIKREINVEIKKLHVFRLNGKYVGSTAYESIGNILDRYIRKGIGRIERVKYEGVQD